MPWRRPAATWAWSAALPVGIVLALAVRVLSGWGSEPAAGQPPAAAPVAPPADDLATTAGRLCQLQAETSAARQQLLGLQAQATARRQEIAALDRMLADGSFTQSPEFLKDETTVRALQRIVREAAASAPGDDNADMNAAAAAVARDRLTRRLEVLRDQRLDQLQTIQSQAETVRVHLRERAGEMEALQQQVRQQLRAAGPAVPAAARKDIAFARRRGI